MKLLQVASRHSKVEGLILLFYSANSAECKRARINMARHKSRIRYSTVVPFVWPSMNLGLRLDLGLNE